MEKKRGLSNVASVIIIIIIIIIIKFCNEETPTHVDKISIDVVIRYSTLHLHPSLVIWKILKFQDTLFFHDSSLDNLIHK